MMIPHLRHEYFHPMPIKSNHKNSWHLIADMPRMETRHATNFKIIIDWNDQGHGLEEGKFKVALMRGPMHEVAEWVYHPAPHHRRKMELLGHASTHGMFFRPGVMRKGDHFRLSYHVGGGLFAHSLEIHHFNFTYWSEGNGGLF